MISPCCSAAGPLHINEPPSPTRVVLHQQKNKILVVNQTTNICYCCCGAGTPTTSASCQTAGWPLMSSWPSFMPSMEPPCRPPVYCRPPWTATPSSMLLHREEALKACQAPGEPFVMFCVSFCTFATPTSFVNGLWDLFCTWEEDKGSGCLSG